jgi:L-ascorbate metabolism protein UlaG (beta-lactamase superfamily)
MKVTYIYHSCYLIESAEFSVLIDFYRDTIREDGTFWIKDYLLGKNETLYVLSSHSHSDHFNPEILTWKSGKKNIHYIFSKEILDSGNTKAENACYLDKFCTFADENLKVQAFGSTDIGHSFVLHLEEKIVFHAGDLNNWHWAEEVPAEESLSYENSFLCELKLLAEREPHLYLAMFPVDPRLGADYMRGAQQFVSQIQTDYFLPMHFGNNFDKANAFAPIAKQFGCKFLSLLHRGESFIL